MTREFTISINGVTLSVSAVDALLAKLDALDDRIDSLSDADADNLRLSLEDIRKELEDNVDNWEDISDKIEDATREVEQLELACRDLDNPLKSEDVREFNEEVKSVEKSLKSIEDTDVEINSNDIDRASARAADLATNLLKVQRAEDLLGNKLNVNIGGLSLEFDDVNQAIGILEDKLYQLANSGLKNSKQFKDITALIVNLRTAVKQVDTELENAFSGGLNKAIQGVQGLTAIASVTLGIGGLFGIEGLDETIQKFASLSLILNGLKEIQEQLRTSNGFVAQSWELLNKVANVTLTTIGKVGNTITLGVFDKLNQKIQQTGNYFKALQKLADLKIYYSEVGVEATNKNLVKVRDLFNSLLTVSNEIDFSKVFNDKIVTQLARFGDVVPLIDKLKDLNLPEEEFKQATEYIKEFQNSLDPATTEFRNMIQEIKNLGVSFKELDGANFSGKLKLWQAGLVGVANGVKVVGAAFKTLLKSTIIFGLIQAAIEAISWAWDKLVGGFKGLLGWNLEEQVSQFESMEQAINSTNESINRYKLNLLKLVDTKVISNQTRLNDTVAEYNRLLIAALNNLKNLKSAQALSFDTNNTWFTGADIENLEDFTKQFEILLKAVLNGTDRFKALEGETEEVKKKFGGNWFELIWNSAGDAASDFAAAQKKVIEDIQYRLNTLDVSKGEEEIKKFIDLLNTPMYLVSLANIENLFPEDEYAKVLAANIKLIREYYDEIQNLQIEAEVEALNLQDLITDNNIAAIRNRFERERVELDNGYNREIRDASDNEALKLSILNKYATLREALLKSQANEARNIQNQINANEIAAMQDGLAKRLAELELSRQQEIDSARDSEIKVGEQVAAINKKYDAEILKVKTEFYQLRLRLLEDYSEQYRLLWNEIAQMEYDIAETRINNRYEDKANELQYTEDSLDNIRNYYDKVRDLANENAEKIAQINKERISHDTDDELESEKKRSKDRLQVIEEDYKAGLLSKEEYDKAVQDENDVHYKMLETITRSGELKLIDILREYEETARNNNATAINERINAIREAFDNIQYEPSISNIGVINYNATKRSLEKAKGEYEQIFKEIEEEWNNLQEAFEKSEISFGDFRQALKELDNMKRETIYAQRENKATLDILLQETIESVSNLVSSYIGVLGGLWSTYNDILMMLIEQEQARLEQEYDMLEEAYEKLEELTLKHTDKLNDIEDELKTSRGDRRAHLIELLNAERAAMLASLAEEQRIDKEKEANLKKQDALERKRREQEKKNSIVQATINTFTAVTNALAVQPWFVGLALSAVALALGMSQVANIKKLKYASGGLLKGKSHNLGGIPVGNTGIEVEGNEYVVNKKSTSKNLPLIDYINTLNRTLTKDDLMRWFDSGKKNVTNQTKNKFATGGIIPNIPTQSNELTIVIQDDRPIVAEIVDIVNRADNYRLILILSGLN